LACSELTTDLDEEEARAILEPYYVAIREKFEGAGLRRVERTKLEVSPKMHDTPRHFGGCRDDGLVIVVAPELSELDEGIVMGILAHELGHATDFLYPGEFVLGREREVVRRVQAEVSEKQWLRWQRGWDARDADVVEQTADGIASLVWGVPIGYVGPCLLQSFHGARVERPVGLR
jgi:hypothetical protein